MYCCVRANVKDQMISTCQCIDGKCIQIVMIRVIALTPNFIIKQKTHKARLLAESSQVSLNENLRPTAII